MARYSLPDAEQVHELLGSLLVSGVQVTEAPGPLDGNALTVTAAYADEDGAIGALCLCDASAANYAGAALSLIPPGVAEDGAKAGVVEGVILENLHEVLNVCVSLFNGPRLSLRDLAVPGKTVPEDVQSARSSPSARLDVLLDMDRYGMGKMCLLVP